MRPSPFLPKAVRPVRRPVIRNAQIVAVIEALESHRDVRPLRASEIATMTSINPRHVRDCLAAIVSAQLAPVVCDRREGGYRLVDDPTALLAEARRVDSQIENMERRAEALRRMAHELEKRAVPGAYPVPLPIPEGDTAGDADSHALDDQQTLLEEASRPAAPREQPEVRPVQSSVTQDVENTAAGEVDGPVRNVIRFRYFRRRGVPSRFPR